ncbi:type IV toxin-antitoxin system AbiEi family antitoxin domain-containing protein, partial [Salmonella enterica]|uniref:type IV toxin-antitoxin system AbiEi family antitoxin domain-containing protein n=2 Tax=Bacteria TaxID=2 RepID=UPI000EE397DE
MKAWTTAELRDMGLSKEAIRRKLREGALHRVHRGIYSDDTSPLAVARALAHGLRRIH